MRRKPARHYPAARQARFTRSRAFWSVQTQRARRDRTGGTVETLDMGSVADAVEDTNDLGAVTDSVTTTTDLGTI